MIELVLVTDSCFLPLELSTELIHFTFLCMRPILSISTLFLSFFFYLLFGKSPILLGGWRRKTWHICWRCLYMLCWILGGK